MAQLENIETIEKRLWGSADNLRANSNYASTHIQLITAPLFIATKLAAYLGRGRDDIAMSHDLEDIVNVIDGRPEILDEIAKENEDAKPILQNN